MDLRTLLPTTLCHPLLLLLTSRASLLDRFDAHLHKQRTTNVSPKRSSIQVHLSISGTSSSSPQLFYPSNSVSSSWFYCDSLASRIYYTCRGSPRNARSNSNNVRHRKSKTRWSDKELLPDTCSERYADPGTRRSVISRTNMGHIWSQKRWHGTRANPHLIVQIEKQPVILLHAIIIGLFSISLPSSFTPRF